MSEPEEARAHAGGREPEHRPLVGDEADRRLQERGGHLEDEVQEADLGEGERVVLLKHRIDRRQQRLDGVVEAGGRS